MSDRAKGKNDSHNRPPMIEAAGLSKFYGIFTACRDVSFKVYEGELVAFLGPNGAGKSTTMKMLTGYLAPSEGVARIADHDMATDRLAGSTRLGYLPENGPLYPDMTPHSLLNFFASARGMSRSRREERIDAVVEICQLGSVMHKPISKLSKGYRQRLGLAHSLLHEPDVLILDEPTAGLDPNQIREVREVLRRLGERKTILFSTHILQEVEAMASRVIIINEGRLVYDGPVRQLGADSREIEQSFHRLTVSEARGSLAPARLFAGSRAVLGSHAYHPDQSNRKSGIEAMADALLKILRLLVLDAAFLGVCVLLLWPLFAFRKAAAAVLKRNFVGYFSNPTGYVFLCLFVLLTSFAAFWPHEFFTANLANLDQLNRFLPYIMLVFIPAITMSVWAEERRQGTDELLLTLPADDFDIVIGKYLAAAAIFTASLIFSQISNYAVLASLTYGDLDTGLFFATYFGYWLVGLAMLAVGMVASFLTGNLTVGFILGAAFNAPLAFAANADVIIPSTKLARAVSSWSLASNFDDLGRGVISSSSILYFVLVAVVGLYLSMVLIGSRHWSGGRDGHSMFGHYLARTMALLVMSVALVILVTRHDLRYDATLGGVSSLSPKTRAIIRQLNPDHPITIEAFVSAQVPELYVQTRYNLVSLLKEFNAMSRGKINVRLHDDLEPFSDEATIAEQRFGIKPTLVRTRTRGAFRDEQIILGAAFSSGLEKVVVPFFDYGVPVEYELVRSIGTVAQGERKKIGIVRTDAQLFGGFSFAGGMPRQMPKQEIIDGTGEAVRRRGSGRQ